MASAVSGEGARFVGLAGLLSIGRLSAIGPWGSIPGDDLRSGSLVRWASERLGLRFDFSVLIWHSIRTGGKCMTFDVAHDIKPVSYVKSHTADMLKYLDEKQSPIVITQNGEAKAVMLDIHSYKKMLDTMTMMKLISLAEKDIEGNETTANNLVFDEIRKGMADRV